MKTTKELKIFRKSSIDYLKRMCQQSVSYIFDKNSWKSTSPDSYGEFRMLLLTRKSLKRLGNELRIFKAPTIVGIQVTYYKSIAFIFDNFKLQNQIVPIIEDNYLLRDLSASTAYNNDNELKIFKLATIDRLESIYYKNVGK